MLRRIAARGWEADADVFFTTDHGELQGDFGLLFKGPYHVDALMRIPYIWRPAPSAGIAPAEIPEPVDDTWPLFFHEAAEAHPRVERPGVGLRQVLRPARIACTSTYGRPRKRPETSCR